MREHHPPERHLPDARAPQMDHLGIRAQPHLPTRLVEPIGPVDALPIQHKTLVLQANLGDRLAPDHVGGLVAASDGTFLLMSPPVPPEPGWAPGVPSTLGLAAQQTVAKGGHIAGACLQMAILIEQPRDYHPRPRSAFKEVNHGGNCLVME